MTELPKIGAFVLETLTTGMYTNPLDTVREFVQNASDSILLAQKSQLLLPNTGRIEIQIDPARRRFVVRDNGAGIPESMVHKRLINVGMSDKVLAASAGFRGIGRLAAIAYCKKLTFLTSAPGEDVVSAVEIDCESLRKAILPAMRQVEELADVMQRYSRVFQERRTKSTHFFQVEMDGVAESASQFLDWQELEVYLGQVAPVAFDAQRFLYAPRITEWVRAQGLSLPVTTVVIKAPNAEREVFKPYQTRNRTSHVRGGNFDFYVKDICFYPEHVTPESTFWVWYGKTDLLGTIEDEQVAGLRLRAKNISIGGADPVTELFGARAKTDGRFNAWYMGEIHITTPDAIPNARRDGFEDTQAWLRTRTDLLSFIQERIKDVRRLSQDRNQPRKIERSAMKVVDEADQRLKTGFVSREQREDMIEKVAKTSELAQEALRVRQPSAEAGKLHDTVAQLERTRLALQETGGFVVDRLQPSLDRKQRRLVREILELLYAALDAESYKRAETAILDRFSLQKADAVAK